MAKDDGSILLEGKITGDKGYFDMPLALNIFGSSESTERNRLREKFTELKLPLENLKRVEREQKRAEKQRQKEQEKQDKINKREQAKEAKLQAAAARSGAIRVNPSSSADGQEWTNLASSGGGGSNLASNAMDEIMSHVSAFDPREISAIVDKHGADEQQLSKMPAAKQPSQMRTKLLPYQLQGLAWLLDRESPTLNSSDTVELWQCEPQGGYLNIATNFYQQNPKLSSGGILADDMGLGKTLQTISLIVADPHADGSPTLIVCPLSVMSNWSSQIETHVSEKHSLKILTYHGSSRKADSPQELRSHNVVITTYETLALEYMPDRVKAKPLPRKTGLYSIQWRRVVLDEGHSIRNPKAKKSLAAFAIASMAGSKWVLTGTPIVNNLKDLQSHCRFIGLSGGLEQAEVFSACIIRPINQGTPSATMVLQALIGTICLRRMKNMKFIDLKLPGINQQKYTVPWRTEERKKYDALGSEAKGLLEGLQAPRRTGQADSTSFSHLLEVLLRCRQMCNHWTLCRDRITNLMSMLEQEKQVSLTPENKQALQDLLQLSIDSQEDCPVCLEVLHNPRITTCGHAFGGECIERVIETQHKCPMCRTELADLHVLIEPGAAMGESTQTDPQLSTKDGNADSSSKIDALLDILRATHGKDPETKTIVFSQWTSFLDIIENHLHRTDLNYTRLDGKMSAPARDAAINALNNDPDCNILLASLSVCGVGLNLTAANQVILMDSWWSAAIEDQAVDRVYRLGQKRSVNVWRLVMEESIEERVLEVQKEKRNLVQTAFGAARTGSRGTERVARLGDIERLLG